MSDTGPASKKAHIAKCPICGKAVASRDKYYPFCSERCKKIDLGKWIKGDYKISRPIEQSDLDEQ